MPLMGHIQTDSRAENISNGEVTLQTARYTPGTKITLGIDKPWRRTQASWKKQFFHLTDEEKTHVKLHSPLYAISCCTIHIIEKSNNRCHYQPRKSVPKPRSTQRTQLARITKMQITSLP